jgi:glutamate dehydrogenase
VSDKQAYISPTLSYQRLQNAPPLTDAELHDKIRRSVANKHELQVLESLFIFNKSVISSLRFELKLIDLD